MPVTRAPYVPRRRRISRPGAALMLAVAALVLSACLGSTADQGGAGAGTSSEGEGSAEAPAKVPGELTVAGERFPAMDVAVLEPGAGFATTLDLGPLLGKKTVVFGYFLLGHPVSEQIVGEVARFIKDEFTDQVAFYPVTRLGLGHTIADLEAKASEMGLDGAVIIDDIGLIKDTLGAATVPNITLIDSEGYVAFRGASSLKQNILSGTDVAEAIRISAKGEQPPSVFKLTPHYPATDFVGTLYKDFVLRDYKTGAPLKLSDQIRPGKITAILYWSPEDRYSLNSLPAFVAAHKTYSERFLNLLSVLREGTVEHVDAVAAEKQIPFPILADPDKTFVSLYRAVSTPTLIIIRPDGIIDSVYTSGTVNYLPVFMTKIRNIITAPGG